MQEFYQIIEDKIHSSGYKGHVDGSEIYNEICDEIENKDLGSYLFMSKKDGDILFEYKIDILEDQFNLSYLNIHTPAAVYHVDFDA